MTNSETKHVPGQKRLRKDTEKKSKKKKEPVKEEANEPCPFCNDHPEGFYAGADSEDDVFIPCPCCGNEGVY